MSPRARDPDPLELYRWAVQDPETHALLLELIYERVRDGRSPEVLREDFAGTSAESVAWVALAEGRRAVAVDRDGATLAWARRRAGVILGDDAARVRFVEGDVRAVAPPEMPEADVLAALNFSVCYLHTRASLVAYLEHARRCLAPGGIVVLNLFGGDVSARVDRHRVTPAPRLPGEAAAAPFEYAWEQRGWDAVTQVLDCRVHFRLDPTPGADARELRDAFTYRFRVWGLAEMREALREAGFAEVQVWRHTHDAAKGEVFLGEVASLDEPGRWTAYVVALR
jgi:SAM-dependent methyltransferase